LKLTNKRILVISPSNWGNMHISKHHYSIELSKLGNTVFYLEPAVSSNKMITKIWQPMGNLPDLNVITTSVPKLLELIRFKYRPLYNFLIQFFISRLLRNFREDFDIVWCFETNLYSNLRLFKAKYVIFHPVDQLIYKFQRQIAQSADIVFHVSQTISDELKGFHDKVYFINHGISAEFEMQAKRNLAKIGQGEYITPAKIKVGYVGNLLRAEFNRDFFEIIIKKHKDIEFHFWGPYKIEMSNIDGNSDAATEKFISFLMSRANVVLHGVKAPSDLCKEVIDMDAFVFCPVKSKSFDASNSHKIMEYLSMGKVIISENVSTYNGGSLIEMIDNSISKELVTLFNEVISNISFHNFFEKQSKRIEFSLRNSYKMQVIRVEELINAN